jgi:hypothetical protein
MCMDIVRVWMILVWLYDSGGNDDAVTYSVGDVPCRNGEHGCTGVVAYC